MLFRSLSMGPYLITGRIDADDSTNIVAEDLKVLSAQKVLASLEKDSVENKFYGDEEKITEEDFELAKALDRKKLRTAYAG